MVLDHHEMDNDEVEIREFEQVLASSDKDLRKSIEQKRANQID